jgi:RNA polymerase sigma factor (sigma-70 family)
MRRLKRGSGSPGLDSLLRDGVSTGLTDEELLKRFATRRDWTGEIAFTTLVARHGPMVMNVCRRILREPADADDAFQATFLVLVRRAGSLRIGTSLGPWLYGVSVRVARRVRAAGVGRSTIGNDADVVEAIADPDSGLQSKLDLRLAIGEALDHLPDNFRSAIVLCHLEGLTHEEAADRLKCPVGTIRSRLARGRALLRGQLERSGLGPPAGSSRPGSQTDCNGAGSIVSAHLSDITVQAATRLAAGQPLAESVSARLAGIVAGVARAMMISKLTITVSLFVATGLAAWAVSSGLAAPQSPVPVVAGEPVATAGPILLAATQTPSETAKKGSGPAHEEKADGDSALLAEFPAVVLRVEPPLGATGVDPALREIRVTFSKRMKDQNWSWVTYDPDMFPKVDGKIHYEKDRRTCVLPVKLEPDKTYWIGISSERFHNFKDLNGRPALPYIVAFRTRSAR